MGTSGRKPVWKSAKLAEEFENGPSMQDMEKASCSACTPGMRLEIFRQAGRHPYDGCGRKGCVQ